MGTGCLVCGNPVASTRNKYCSRKCYWGSKIGKKPWNKIEQKHRVRCDICNDFFDVIPARETKAKYCSRECYSEAKKQGKSLGPQCRKQRHLVTCTTCGKPKWVILSRSKRPAHFCDDKCRAQWLSENVRGEKSPNWLGGHDEYRGPDWCEQRRKALQRDEGACVRCGETRDLAVHHKVPFRFCSNSTEANRLENLETLCVPCHRKAEVDFYRRNPEYATLAKAIYMEAERGRDRWRLIYCFKCGEPFEAISSRQKYCVDCLLAVCPVCGKAWHDDRAVTGNTISCSIECATKMRRKSHEGKRPTPMPVEPAQDQPGSDGGPPRVTSGAR